MTDQTKPEGGQEPASQGLPIPKLENASAASATSSVDTEALAELILKKLDPILDKKLQSTKDKRIAAIEKQLNLGNFAELEEMGAQIPDNVKLEYRLRQLEGNKPVTEVQSQTPPSAGTGAALTAQDVQEVINTYKLDANDAAVLEKLRGTYTDRNHFEATMARLAVARQTTPPTTPASTTALQSAPVRAGERTPEQLAKEYNEKAAQVVKTMRGDERARELARLKETYREAGAKL